MTYSEFLSLMIKNIQGQKSDYHIYLCNEAKLICIAKYGNPNNLAKEEFKSAQKHGKRFLKHINILLTNQHKMVCKEHKLNPAETYKPTVLNKYFNYSYSDKLNWLIALRDKHRKLESKA